jgi:glycosyltransferase involved in cell wall biosynthesis
MKNKKTKILFATPVLGYPAVGGPKLRIENSIKALSLISDLHLYSRVTLKEIGGPAALSFYNRYCSGFYFAPFTKAENSIAAFLKRIINLSSRLLISRNIVHFQEESEKDFQDVLKTADDIKADLIWLGYGNISYPLLKYIKEHSDYKVVLDTDSVWSKFVLRGLPYARNEKERKDLEASGKAKEEEESWGTQLADVTTAVSEVDREYYQGLVEDNRKVMIFSNVVDLNNYDEKPVNMAMKRPSLYLAGTFWKGSPMEEAARWMIEKVMPIIWNNYPGLQFYILGNNSEETLKDIRDGRVSVLGTVDSVLPYLCNVDVVVVPLKFESGTRFKILEAAACGIPIVSTTLGAEGIPVVHGRDIMIADTPEDFAASIAWILMNKEKARELAGNCRKLIEEKYGLKAARKEAEEILRHLIG